MRPLDERELELIQRVNRRDFQRGKIGPAGHLPDDVARTALVSFRRMGDFTVAVLFVPKRGSFPAFQYIGVSKLGFRDKFPRNGKQPVPQLKGDEIGRDKALTRAIRYGLWIVPSDGHFRDVADSSKVTAG